MFQMENRGGIVWGPFYWKEYEKLEYDNGTLNFKNTNHVNVWRDCFQRLRSESVTYGRNWKSVQLDGEIQRVTASEAGKYEGP